MDTSDQPRPNEHSYDMNGNPLPLAFRVLRALGFGIIGIFVLSSIFLGADSTLGKSQFVLGIGGGVVAVTTMRLIQSHESTFPSRRFAMFSFLGVLVSTVAATVLFGGWSVSDGIAFGLGAGVVNGFVTTLGAAALRTAVLSFYK